VAGHATRHGRTILRRPEHIRDPFAAELGGIARRRSACSSANFSAFQNMQLQELLEVLA
jgi:hypothetical protein